MIYSILDINEKEQNKHGRILIKKCSFANCGSCFGELLTLDNCEKDITGYLRYLKVGGDRICAKEADLILYISGLFDVEELCRRLLLVCHGHRDSLGIYWKPSAKNEKKISAT